MLHLQLIKETGETGDIFDEGLLDPTMSKVSLKMIKWFEKMRN